MYAIRKNRWRSINELEGSSPKDQWPIVVQYQRNADIIYMSFLHPQMKIASSSPCWRNSVLLLLFCKQVSQRRHFIDQLSVEDFDVSRHLALLILHQQESTLNDINHRPIIPLLACLCFFLLPISIFGGRGSEWQWWTSWKRYQDSMYNSTFVERQFARESFQKCHLHYCTRRRQKMRGFLWEPFVIISWIVQRILMKPLLRS